MENPLGVNIRVLEHALDFVFQHDVDEAVDIDAPEMEKEEGVLIEAHADAVHGGHHMLAHQRPVRELQIKLISVGVGNSPPSPVNRFLSSSGNSPLIS